MKILASIRQTVDHNVIVRPAPDGGSADVASAPRAINPFDEIALEAALRLKEDGMAEAVIAVSIGPKEVEKALRTALAMGADTAVHVLAPAFPAPPDVAALLAEVARRRETRLVLMGKQEIDDDFGVTAQMLAGRLGWPQAMFAAAIEAAPEERGGDEQALHVVCEHDRGTRTLRVPLPCVIAAELRLAEPRFVSLANMMKARRRPIERVTPADLGVRPWRRLEMVAVRAAQQARAARMLDGVDELLDILRRHEAWPS